MLRAPKRTQAKKMRLWLRIAALALLVAAAGTLVLVDHLRGVAAYGAGVAATIGFWLSIVAIIYGLRLFVVAKRLK